MKVVACILALALFALLACGGDKPGPATPSATGADAATSTTQPEMGGREGAADGGGLGPIGK